MIKPNPRVLQWIDDIESQLEAFDLGDLVHSVDLLALIHVESAGDPNAHRPGSQFRGLLQIGRPYFTDALEWLGHSPRSQETLHGDGVASIAATLAYLCRYATHHQWDPTLIAVLHKGGPRTCRIVRDEERSGGYLHAAIDHAESSIPLPNLREYVRRFREARAIYAAALIDSIRVVHCTDMGLA